MQKTIVITDLTKMQGDNVCIAGIAQPSQCIRLVLRRRSGVHRRHLYMGDRLVIRPRVRLRFDVQQVRIDPPHIEDLAFAPDSITYQGMCDDTEWEAVLQASSFNSVQDIYGSLLQVPHWVAPGAETRSLGTVSRIQITSVLFDEWEGRSKYRVSFVDDTGYQYQKVTVNDLAFQAFAATEVSRLQSRIDAAARVGNLLKNADRLYFRLGLARPWRNLNTGRMECWMQVTGIHTFPDYLEGKSFADF